MADFKILESAAKGSEFDLEDTIQNLKFDEHGLVPAIAQDEGSGAVLMLAWMNLDAIRATLSDGYATYFSRSRQSLWRKGETSGHTQRLRSMQFDCDGDAILMKVEQLGPACHTLRETCFYLVVDGARIVVATDPEKQEDQT